MSTLAITLRYRPLRIGWCVAHGDIDGFSRAARLSFTMWGGRFNPIIPVNDGKVAAALINLFRLDALFPISDAPEIRTFIEGFKHLPWPDIHDDLFVPGPGGGTRASIVDVTHPIEQVAEAHFKNSPFSQQLMDMHEWDSNDVLAPVFLATFGAFPGTEATGIDYRGISQEKLFAKPYIIDQSRELEALIGQRHSVASLNRLNIERHYAVRNSWDHAGIYIGRSEDFDDLVNFWNLRASDISLFFFDANKEGRLLPATIGWMTYVNQFQSSARRGPGAAVWCKTDEHKDFSADKFGCKELMRCPISEHTWNGFNVRPPVMYFSEAQSLASVHDSAGRTTISFTLPNRPFVERFDAHGQNYVLSVNPGIGLFKNERATLHMPFIPELNEFYGRNAHFVWNAARAEPDSLGIVSSVETNHLSLRAVEVGELIRQIFNTVGIEASLSQPGLIASTLIGQMGGLDGCRVFKIAGVRSLIENHRPDQSFSRSDAMQTILGQGETRPLADYKWLYIEPRAPGVALTNSAVLSYVLEKGVFRAGLNFLCPSCKLEFWRTLDDARSRLECDYCGHAFNVGPQLRDKGWAFRRSGLFGRNDHQGGAIPVLLTLQQLLGRGGVRQGEFSTAMALKSIGSGIKDCETDFVVVTEHGHDHKIQIAIGECKTHQPITDDDVENLCAIADAFPSDRYEVYIVFARLSPFSAAEVERIKRVNKTGEPRAIMFTDRELEPYFVYERTALEFDIQAYAVSLKDMAQSTVKVFFEERRRIIPSPLNA